MIASFVLAKTLMLAITAFSKHFPIVNFLKVAALLLKISILKSSHSMRNLIQRMSKNKMFLWISYWGVNRTTKTRTYCIILQVASSQKVVFRELVRVISTDQVSIANKKDSLR